jgi:hypothetical protein
MERETASIAQTGLDVPARVCPAAELHSLRAGRSRGARHRRGVRASRGVDAAVNQTRGRTTSGIAFLVRIERVMLDLVVEAHVVHSVEDACATASGTVAQSR